MAPALLSLRLRRRIWFLRCAGGLLFSVYALEDSLNKLFNPGAHNDFPALLIDRIVLWN